MDKQYYIDIIKTSLSHVFAGPTESLVKDLDFESMSLRQLSTISLILMYSRANKTSEQVMQIWRG